MRRRICASGEGTFLGTAGGAFLRSRPPYHRGGGKHEIRLPSLPGKRHDAGTGGKAHGCPNKVCACLHAVMKKQEKPFMIRTFKKEDSEAAVSYTHLRAHET